MKRNKNYTLYLIAGISALLTIPVAVIVFRTVRASLVTKTEIIMIVFAVLFVATLLLYKSIFRVSVQEIAQEEKLTELDRICIALSEERRKYNNPQVKKFIDIVTEQAQRFKRRKEVMLQITDAEEGGAVDHLVQTVEDVLAGNMRRLLNRIRIFDDRGMPEVMRQNITYMEGLLFKNNEIMTDFELLITEASQSKDEGEDQDINRLKDVINAMKSLRTDSDDEIEELAKKYNQEAGR